MEFINIEAVDNVDEVDIEVRIPRQVYLRPDYFHSFSDDEYFKRFRLTKPTTLLLLQQIEDQLEFVTNMNNSISPINQLLLTLRFVATGGHMLSIGDFIQADKSTVSRTVAKVSRAIASLKNRYINMPRNDTEIAAVQNKFFDIAGFPRVVGVVDGTHIRILSQGGINAEVFRNRKGYFSLNVQVVCTADLIIQNIVARWPGSTHDSTIFNNSRLKYNFENESYGNGILLGDSGYMNTPYLLTPYIQVNNQGQQNYNISHIATRVKIEHVFGVWKRRFPILAYGSRLKLQNTLAIITATAILHNIAIMNEEVEPPVENEIMEHELQQMILNGDIPNDVQDNNFDFRQQLVDTYFN